MKCKKNFILLTPCIIHQTVDVITKIKLMTSIKLLHVSTPECHLQGVFRTRRNFILAVYSILLSAFVGICIECKKKLRGD